MTSYLVGLTIGLPWLGALAVWLAGRRPPVVKHALAILATIGSALTAVALLPRTTATAVIAIPFDGPGAGSLANSFGSLTFVPDGLGVFLAIIATTIGCLTVIFSTAYMGDDPRLARYYSLVLLFIGAMAALVLTGSLFFLFIFWEVTALCSYALISFDNDNPAAVAGGLKALIITQLGGLGLLALALLAYSYGGSYQINEFLAAAPQIPPLALATMAFAALAAAAAKSAQVPFHTWLPGAMEAPTPVSALIHAATMVNAGIYLLARLYPAFAGVNGWKTAVVVVGLVSVLLAAVMALFTTDLKRVLAYSTISQLGYLVTAIGSGAIFASQYHLLSHAVFKALLFLAAGAVIHFAGTRDLRKMGGLGRTMPFVLTTFVFGALALAGLPPLNGFWSKELLMENVLSNGTWLYAGLLLGAALTAAYTLRVTWLVFFGSSPQTERAHERQALPAAMRFPLAALAAGTALTWLLAGPLAALLSETLPFHVIHSASTAEVVVEILSAPATYLALAIILLGAWAWWRRRTLPEGSKLPGRTGNILVQLQQAAAADFGFEALNRRIAAGTQGAAARLQHTQTGQLNWNITGLVSALLLLVLALAVLYGIAL